MCSQAEFVALWLGASLMSIGGLMLFFLLLSLVMDYGWRKMRHAAGYADLVRAFREIQARKQQTKRGDV